MTPQRPVSYEELEDRYFKVVDENKSLKEKLKEQDKRIKECAHFTSHAPVSFHSNRKLINNVPVNEWV
jgi:hypothetical protein